MSVNEGEFVLDAILRLRAEQVPDLAVRWTARTASAARAKRSQRLPSVDAHDPVVVGPRTTVIVSPMRTFPVIRSLVTDVTCDYERRGKGPLSRGRMTTPATELGQRYGRGARLRTLLEELQSEATE